LGCVNKRHLSWKTRAENLAEMVEHGNSTRGERHIGSKLTEAQVVEIKSLLGAVTQAELGRRFGVPRQTIHSIRSRQSWAWL
jgi:predicted HTH transcriptional regulator